MAIGRRLKQRTELRKVLEERSKIETNARVSQVLKTALAG
jgi:hypothetical protein